MFAFGCLAVGGACAPPGWLAVLEGFACGVEGDVDEACGGKCADERDDVEDCFRVCHVFVSRLPMDRT